MGNISYSKMKINQCSSDQLLMMKKHLLVLSIWIVLFGISLADTDENKKEYCLTADEKKEVESLLPSDKPEDIKKKFELIQEIIGENHVHPHEGEWCLDVSEENIIKLQKLLKEKDLTIANKGIQLMYKGFAGKMKKKE